MFSHPCEVIGVLCVTLACFIVLWEHFTARIPFSLCFRHIPDNSPDGTHSSGLEQGPQPEPVCRVKRYAGTGQRVSPLACPTESGFSKSAPTTPSRLLNRWVDGRLSQDYRPPSVLPGAGSALVPPSFHRSPLGFQRLTVGGLAYNRHSLGVHARGFQPLVALPQPPQVLVAGVMGALPFRPLSTALVPEPVVGINASSLKVQSMHNLHNQLKDQHLRQWLQLLEDARDHSHLFMATSNSEHSESHRLKAAAHFAPSTLSSYLRMWGQQAEFASCHGCSPFIPATTLLEDFLDVQSKSSAQGVASGYIRALTWASKYAGCQALGDTVEMPLIRSYAIPSSPSVRREAAPLPLSFIIWLESCILSASMSEGDRLVMGGMLLLIWGSLRWSDGQWISPTSLIEDSACLRGLARRTKSTNRGMPFGILRQGFLGHTVDSCWCSLWMNLVRQALSRTQALYPDFIPDFVIPQVGQDVDAPLFVAPMSRAQDIVSLRRYLLISDPEADLSFVGVHSCKVTFLSWPRQLGLDEELRRHQGHHRSTGSGSCVSLYSRDDVHPALSLQKILLSKIAEGFSPVTPFLRGAAPSRCDKSVVIPQIGSMMDVDVQTSIELPPMEDHMDTDSDASETPDLEASELSSKPHVFEGTAVSDCIFLLNSHSMVAHLASSCEESDPQCICLFEINGSHQYFKFACGARRTAGDTSISP